jgi:FtsZ-binding cell division protein ZapB
MFAAVFPNVLYPVLSAAALMGGAAFAFIGSARKAQIEAAKDTISLQGSEIEALKEADARKDVLIADLNAKLAEQDGALRVLNEKFTQSKAVDNLSEVLNRMIDKNAADHADLAALFGKMTR